MTLHLAKRLRPKKGFIRSESRLQEVERELESLRAKQGRLDRFATASQRDEFLRQSCSSIAASIERVRLQAAQIEANRSQTLTEQRVAQNEIDECKLKLNSRKTELSRFDDEFHQLKEAREHKESHRKLLWSNEAKLVAATEGNKEEFDKAQRALVAAMDRNTSRGLKSVEEIVKHHNIRGYHGPLYELFDCPDKYRDAVDVVASGSMFHVVVDNDETASRILDILNQERGGRVTFMPLNRINPRPTTYPNSNEVISIMDVIEFKDQYKNAIMQVFGKSIIAQSLEAASTFSRSHKLTAVTLDGDRADRKGAISGGYRDSKRSRLDSTMLLKSYKQAMLDNEANLVIAKSEIQVLNQDILQIRDSISRLDSQRRQVLGSRDPLNEQIRTLSKRTEVLQTLCAENLKSKDDLDAAVRSLENQLHATRSDIGTPLCKELTATERTSMDRLILQHAQLKNVLNGQITDRTTLETRKKIIEIELFSNLMRRSDELKGELEKLSEKAEVSDSVDIQNVQLQSLNSRLAQFAIRLEELDNILDDSNVSLGEHSRRLEKTTQSFEAVSRDIEKQQSLHSKYVNRKSLLIQKKAEAMNHIGVLGLLPEDAFEKYNNVSSSDLLAQLHGLNQTLKNYGNVNKKAFEQFSSFTKQRQQLEVRKQDQDTAYEEIQGLIKVLDMRKEEAIHGTFQQAAANFSSVWTKLVPDGVGCLEMVCRELNVQHFKCRSLNLKISNPMRRK